MYQTTGFAAGGLPAGAVTAGGGAGVYGGGVYGGGVAVGGGAVGGGAIGGGGFGGDANAGCSGCCVSDAACGTAACGTAICGTTPAGPAQLHYVGPQMGSYRTEYAYVGAGAGDFEYIQPKKPTYCACYCSVFICLLLLLLAFFLFGPSTQTTTKAAPLPTCHVFACPMNFVAKANAASIVGHDVNTCCEKTCGSFQCATGFTLKLNAATIRGMDLHTCCDQQACNSFHCPADYLPKPANGNGRFGHDINSCCDKTCSGFQCAVGFHPNSNLNLIRHPSNSACCHQPTCETYACPAGYRAKLGRIVGHDMNTCCETTCGQFQCAPGSSLLPAAASITGQSQEVCCKYRAKSTCIVYGDPHCDTFDHKHNDYYVSGDFWIVKSSTMKIQGRYLPTKITRGLSVTKEVSMGGPWLKNHVIMVSPVKVTVDGKEILTTFPGSYNLPGVFHVDYNAHGKILQPHRELGKNLKVLHFHFHDGTFIQINQWTNPEEGTFVNVMVEMHSLPDQDGHCGNFNGNSVDDDRLAIRKRIGNNGVAENELIGFTDKIPIKHSFEGYPTISECASNLLTAVHAQCQAEEHHFIPSMGCLAKKCEQNKGKLGQ